MKKLHGVAAALFFAAVLSFSSGPVCAADPQVVARVGNVPVTEYDLNRELKKILPRMGGFHGKISEEKVAEGREKALETLLERAALVQYAIREQLTVAPVEIDAAYDAIRQNFASEADFLAHLGGESPAELRGALYRRRLAQQAEADLKEQAKVDDAEVARHYEENRGKYLRPRQFRASMIHVKVDPALPKEARDKLKAKADDLLARAKAGEDFHDLAYYNSDDRTRYVGGDIGYFHEGQMKDKDIGKAVSQMQPGEITGIENIYGYHIIKLVDLHEPTQLALEDVAAGVRLSLEKARYEELFQETMASIASEFPVVVCEPPVAVETSPAAEEINLPVAEGK